MLMFCNNAAVCRGRFPAVNGVLWLGVDFSVRKEAESTPHAVCRIRSESATHSCTFWLDVTQQFIYFFNT